MSTELDDLFAEASPEPGGGPDATRLWAQGRRRRRVRQAGAVLGTVAAVAVVGVAATGLDSVGTPTVDPTATPQAGEEPVYELEREPNELAEVELPEGPVSADEDPDDAPDEPEDAGAGSGPEPDASRVADPCAAHRDGEPRAFIDVVSPVEGQQADGSVDLVGCASVHEATVRYRLIGPGEEVVTDSFTTATAGGPEIGEFRETITLAGAGPHVLEVFWDSPADGSEADKSTIVFEGR